MILGKGNFYDINESVGALEKSLVLILLNQEQN